MGRMSLDLKLSEKYLLRFWNNWSRRKLISTLGCKQNENELPWSPRVRADCLARVE